MLRLLPKVIISVCLLLSGFINPAIALAEDLPTVVVSATRSERSTVNTRGSINIISKKEIERSGAINLSEVLRGQPGIQLSDLFGDASSTVIGLRGFAENANANTLIMVDGRRLNYSDTRAPDLSYISLNDIERIEIIEGSSGVLFGDQAVGGVVNIITIKPEKFNATIGLQAGSYGRRGGSAYLSDKQENGLFYKLNFAAYETDNYRDHNEHSNVNISAYIGQEYSSGNVFLESQKVEDDLNLPGALIQSEIDVDRRQINSGFANDFSNTDTSVNRVGISHAFNDKWLLEVEVTNRKVEQDVEQSFRDNPSGLSGFANRDLTSLNPRFIGSIPVNDDEMLIVFGIDQENTDYELFLPNAFGTAQQKNDQDMSSFYSQVVLPLNKKYSTTFGARKAKIDNEISDTGTFTFPVINEKVEDDITVTELGLNIKTSDNSDLTIRVDENFRFAKIDEFSLAVGNMLKTQEGRSWEIGFKKRLSKSEYKILVYRLDLENEIFFDPSIGLFGANVNLDKTIHDGLIFDYSNNLTNAVDITFNYTYTDAKIESGLFDGNKISGVAGNIATLRFNYLINSKTRVYGELLGVDDKYAQGDNANTQEKIRGYAVLNAYMSYKLKNIMLSARLNNLLNMKYTEFVTNNGFGAAYQPSPERNLLFNASYEF